MGFTVSGYKFLDGWARMVGLVAISVSLLGWLIFAICFGNFNNADNFYNDVRENRMVRLREPVTVPIVVNGVYYGTTEISKVSVEILLGDDTDEIIEEDFPKDRADSDFFTFYFFVVVYPIAALLTVAHLFLHGIPILGFIMSLTAHFLLTLSLICGAGVFLAEGNRLFSEDNNYRNEYGSALLPEDWRTDPYWGSWLVGEWFGVLFTGICVIVYYTVTPFFTNSGKLFSTSNDEYEMQETKKVLD